MAVRSRRFRTWLARRYYLQKGEAVAGSTISDVANVAEAAAWEGPEHRVFTRLAHLDGRIFVDLGDPRWRVVEIGAMGWAIRAESQVKFRRTAGMLALPEPERHGTLDPLLDFVNVSRTDWPLLLGWQLGCFSRGPYPVLALLGEQGTAKSTTVRMLRALVDPNTSPVRSEPRDTRDLMIAAKNGWVIAFDNVSRIQPWLSDSICRLATGGGFSTRQLYTDDDEVLFDSMRPVVLNAITDVVTRGDLLDRALLVEPPRIPDSERRPESELWKAFNSWRPRLLGALLDAVAAAIVRLPETRLSELPRMADFALWVTASEDAAGLSDGEFIKAYGANREAAHVVAIESSVVGDQAARDP